MLYWLKFPFLVPFSLPLLPHPKTRVFQATQCWLTNWIKYGNRPQLVIRVVFPGINLCRYILRQCLVQNASCRGFFCLKVQDSLGFLRNSHPYSHLSISLYTDILYPRVSNIWMPPPYSFHAKPRFVLLALFGCLCAPDQKRPPNTGFKECWKELLNFYNLIALTVAHSDLTQIAAIS